MVAYLLHMATCPWSTRCGSSSIATLRLRDGLTGSGPSRKADEFGSAIDVVFGVDDERLLWHSGCRRPPHDFMNVERALESVLLAGVRQVLRGDP